MGEGQRSASGAPANADERVSLFRSLTAPRATLLALMPRLGGWATFPWGQWGALAAIAVGGSLVFGGSLSLVLTNLPLWGAAVWLTFAAGASWCVFGPMLMFVTRRSIPVCVHACLVTMAHGEFILLCGAVINAACWVAGWPDQTAIASATMLNLGIVGVSNVAMAASLAGQLSVVGVAPWKTVALWVLVLNGCGAVFGVLGLPLLLMGG